MLNHATDGVMLADPGRYAIARIIHIHFIVVVFYTGEMILTHICLASFFRTSANSVKWLSGSLTCVDSDEPLQPPFKLRNSK